MATTSYPIRTFSKLNIKVLITTNAAGGLNGNYKVCLKLVVLLTLLTFVGQVLSQSSTQEMS